MKNQTLHSIRRRVISRHTTQPRFRVLSAAAAVLVAASGGLRAQQEPMPSAFKTVAGYPLVEVFTPVPNCVGWGKWDGGPFLIANRGDTPAQFPYNFSSPARSIVVHPGSDRDVAIGWTSPITGRVSVQARVTSADGNGGDGVHWAIFRLSASGEREVLAQGGIGRGESRTIPAAAEAVRFAALPVREGEGLLLAINRKGGYDFDSTLLEWVITEHGGAGRAWDLAKDVSGNPDAGNPQSGKGSAGAWHFLASMDDLFGSAALQAPRERPGKKLQSWSLATEDTKLTLGATADGQLCVYELSNPADGWNWAKEPSVFSVPVPASGEAGRWKFKDATVGKADGQQVAIRYVCENPGLELQSVWSAKPGRGPIRHALQVVNRSSAPVALQLPPSMFLDLAGPANEGALTMWTFHTDGKTPDKQGVYRHVMHESAARRIDTEPETGLFIPYAVFDSAGKRGFYLGVEWSVCSIQARGVAGSKPGSVRVRAGETEAFVVTLAPGETFEAPPAFVGAYRGDVDDAGNSLRRFLFNHGMPEVVRKDPTYPKIQWNACGATTDPVSWNCVEQKFYPFVDDVAPLGFEEVMIDVGWWKGGTAAPEPETDPVDWPSGMAKAADYTKKAGMRFGLYWNKGEDMASAEGRNRRITHIKRLFNEYGADMWRSDSTAGPVIGSHYAAVKGFYAMLGQLGSEIPNFQWENCCCGGRIKDFGAMKHAVKVFLTDTYEEHHVRQAFYTSSYMFPPAQLMGCVGSNNYQFRPRGADGMRFAFRSMSLGAPEWFLDAPNGGNGTAPWTDEERAAVKAATNTYKTRIRPLVRTADLYHILPRPDGKNWDGIQYYDPATKKGVIYLFKPSPVADTITLKLRGVEPATRYRVTFEDGSNPAVEKTGAELANGLDVTLKGAPASELVFLEPSAGAAPQSSQERPGHGANASQPQYTNPVHAGSMPDPSVIRHDGFYYAFGTTGAERTPDGRIFTVLRSKDLMNWEPLGGALVPPSDNKAALYWAPDVAAANGKFYLYYSMGGLEPEKFELRVGISSKPEGPYIDSGEKLTDCDNNRFTIDAYPFQDDDGQWYLYYARNFTDSIPGAPGEAMHPGTAIVVAPLVGMTRLGAECKVVVRARYDWTLYEANRRMDVYGQTFNWHTIEGPCVVKHNGKYYCFYSGSNWQSERYGVDYVVADSPMGPFRDQGSRPRVLSGVPGKVRGPGHHSIAASPDGNSLYLVYHAWDAGMKERQLAIDKLVWTPEGPRCEGPTYTPQPAPQ
jgi:arabinan endo-1,5-alpha-L-arabinosidase